MKFQFDSRSAFFDALEEIRRFRLRDRTSSNVDTLTITADADVEGEVYNILLDAGLLDEDRLPGEDMDGDHASGLASAGFGTDEDYEHNSFDEGW